MIGSLPISKITAQEALAVLRKMEGNGRYESARRMRSVLIPATPNTPVERQRVRSILFMGPSPSITVAHCPELWINGSPW